MKFKGIGPLICDKVFDLKLFNQYGTISFDKDLLDNDTVWLNRCQFHNKKAQKFALNSS